MIEFVSIGFVLGVVATMIFFARWLSNEPRPAMTELWYGLVPCSGCKGSGEKESKPCEVCRGEGLMSIHLDRSGKPLKGSRMVKKETRENLYNQGHKVLIKCPRCDGAGRYHMGEWTYSTNNPEPIFEPCELCDGTGSIFGYFDEKGKIKNCDWCKIYGGRKRGRELKFYLKCPYCGGTAWTNKIK